MRNICRLLCLILIQISIQDDREYYYPAPSDFIDYLNDDKPFDEINPENIIDNLIKIFKDVYAFNDIANNPPQPSFDGQYHTKVNIIEELEKIKDDIKSEEIEDTYNFVREIKLKTAELKDCHININGFFSDLVTANIFSPFEFYIKEDNGEQKIFASLKDDAEGCDQDLSKYRDKDLSSTAVTTINGLDPFEYISKFCGDFDSTKNIHGTFSYKLLSERHIFDNPVSSEDLDELKVIFSNSDSITTYYCIKTDIDIKNRRIRRLHEKKDETKNNKNNKTKKHIKRRVADNGITWDHTDSDNKLKCKVDDNNQINIFHLSSFSPDKSQNYLETLESCLKSFDGNTYPILVVNELNEGGLVYLSQIFLGALSQLTPIDLYKGRLRFPESFNITDDIRKYIISYLVNNDTCSAANYDDLAKNSITVDYGNNVKSNLSQMFFINNKTCYDKIEELRNKTKNKRKPTEILFLTDGYTFSSAGLLAKYLKRSGGGIIASYMGNPKEPNKAFDIGQSPSPLFNKVVIGYFSKESINNKEMRKLKIEMPGIQSFFDYENPNIPLEYDVDFPDEKTNMYLKFTADNYDKFVNKAKEILDKYKTECNPENKRLVKYTEECDKEFGNSYTHGGYQCGEDGKWSNKCVISNCDSGYYLDRKTNQCIKHVCSISFSSSEDDDDDSDIVVIKQKNEGYFMNLSLIIYLYSLLLFFF